MIVRRKLVVAAAALLGTAAAGAPARGDSAPAATTTQLVSSTPAPPAPSRAESASDLFRRANKLYDERRLKEAESLYRQAWELQQTYDIASNFGALELDLAKPTAAAELFAFALRHFPARGKPADRAGIEARFETAKKLVCMLRVKVAPAGAEVLIDGRSVGTTPLPGEVFVAPGSRTIVARQAGRLDAREVVLAAAGGTREVTLTLEPFVEPPRRSSLPGIVTGAAGVLALGAGAALVGLAETSRTDAQAKHDALAAAGTSCATPSAACSELTGLTARTDTLGNAGIGLLVAGGALAAVGITYALWPVSGPGPKKTGEAPLRASIGASPAGGGVLLTGSF